MTDAYCDVCGRDAPHGTSHVDGLCYLHRPLRYSTLKHIARSPAHYRHAVHYPHPSSKAMQLGTMVHHLVLGATTDDDDRPIVIYDGERKGKAWSDFKAANPGAVIFLPHEMDEAHAIADAVRESSQATAVLDGAAYETHIAWAIDGRAASSRLDVDAPDIVADLKTTTDASPRAFERQILKMHYHVQAAMYRDARAHIGRPALESLIIAVEVKPPYVVQVYRISPELLEEGRRTYRGWYETLKVCEDSDHWPGYAQTAVDVQCPAWMVCDPEDDGSAEDDEDTEDDGWPAG